MNKEQFKNLYRAYRVTSQYNTDEGPGVPERLEQFSKFRDWYGSREGRLYTLLYLWKRVQDARCHPEWFRNAILPQKAFSDTIRRCMRANRNAPNGTPGMSYPCFWQTDEELKCKMR